MCYRKVLYNGWRWLCEWFGPLMVIGLVLVIVILLGFAIRNDLRAGKRFDQYIIDNKFDPVRVKRFLRYNEKLNKEDFMEDPYVMNLYKVYLGEK